MGDQAILVNLIAAQANSNEDFDVLTFVHVGADGKFVDETRNYRTLYNNGQCLASGLVQEGMRKGDRFALLMQNHPEFVDLMVASSICGTVFVPIDSRCRGEKLTYMLNFSGCRGIIVADYVLEQLLTVLPQTTGLEWVWVLKTGALSKIPDSPVRIRWFSDLLIPPANAIQVAIFDTHEPMQMLFTSGTTGDPKAIMSTYQRFDNVSSAGGLLGMRDTDCLYTGLSLTHANAQLITLGNALKMGVPCVISRKFTKSRLWDICRRYDCTYFTLLGGMTTAIYSEPERPDDVDNPVRMVLSAGMPVAIWDDFSNRFDLQIFEFYGAAEGGMMFNPPCVGPIGSIGKPAETQEARIVDENDHQCIPLTQGEIIFRNIDGSCPPVKYFKNPAESHKKTRDGWLRMGDVGHTDELGWFYFDYRMGGGIRRNGDFVNIGFVEKIVAEYPQINDVFVYGIESGAPGEKEIIAAVVPRADVMVLDTKGLLEHCHKHLDANSVPGFIQIMDEIPKTASEKPQERFCLELFRTRPETVVKTS